NKKKRKNGFIFWTFITLMGIGRFFSDFLRQDPRLLGLSMGQYLSLIMAVIGIYVLLKYYKKF
ncbi:prolipoprotein diacylglyceryl transferase, partial [Candidatus Woesearchaeota archaeon]|nr:prolipoprotein diacylglyceryl transferase [Candidatus Woesearchaeota archaeon]